MAVKAMGPKETRAARAVAGPGEEGLEDGGERRAGGREASCPGAGSPAVFRPRHLSPERDREGQEGARVERDAMPDTMRARSQRYLVAGVNLWI